MKARFLALAALLFGMAACQTEPEGLDVNMDGTTTISVVLPEDAITRATYGPGDAQTDSAKGGLTNTTGEIVRVILQVYYQGNPSQERLVNYLEDGQTVTNFDVRLVPNRDYTFVAWADQVETKDDDDWYYNTSDLKNVTLMAGSWNAMDEHRDAYTATKFIEDFTSSKNITLTLTRPFAKLRVVTTDLEALNNLDIEPTKATVAFATKHYTTFNAYEGVAVNKENEGVAHTKYTIDVYNEKWENNADLTLYADYFFAADEQEVVNFRLDVFDQKGDIIKSNNFNTPIPVKRNNLTTIQGNVLTDGNNIKVTVDEKFAGEFTPEAKWDGKSIVEPTQDANGKYIIDQPSKLAWLAAAVNGTLTRSAVAADNFAGKTFVLEQDIDLGGEAWTPIGNANNAFKGTFDGQNHTIYNLVVRGGNENNKGLFGFTTDGEIKNLVIENAEVSGRLNVGVVAGTPYTSKYTNIIVNGHVEVNGMAYVGGVGGKNAYANWTNITVDVDETSYVKAHSIENGTAYRTYVGGVVGFNGEGGHKFSNISSNINVQGSTCDVGGLFGIAHYGNQFENCVCSGDVEIYAAEEAAEAEEIGGIAGVWHNADDTAVVMTNVEFTGNVTTNIERANVWYGNLVGKYYAENDLGVLTLNGLQFTRNGVDFTAINDILAAGEYTLPFDLTGSAKASNGYGATGINHAYYTLDGGNHTLKVNAGGTWGSAIATKGGTIKNITVAKGFRGIFIIKGNKEVVLENVTIDGPTYTISCDQGMNQNLKAYNSTFNGWTSYAATIGEAYFEGCSFGEGAGYKFARPYAPTTFKNCDFCEGYQMDPRAKVTFVNCRINGVELTADNYNTLVTSNLSNAVVGANVDDTNALKTAVSVAGATVYVEEGEYTFPSSVAAGVTINCAEGTVFTGNSKLNINGATVVGATFSNPSGTAVDQTINGTFKNCTFTGSNALRWCYAGETVVFENCVIDGDTYGIHFDSGANDAIFRGCTISGFNTLGAALELVTFEDCTFVGNNKSDYNGINLWGKSKLINCEFTFDGSTHYEWIDGVDGGTASIRNCTVNGEPLTVANIGALNSESTTFITLYDTNDRVVLHADAQYTYSQDSATVTAFKDGAVVYRGILSENVAPVKSIEVNEGIVRLNNRCFCKNNNLENVTLPNSLTYIDEGVFQQSNIKSITIPENVTYIGKTAFGACGNLETIIINAKDVTFANYVARASANLKHVYIYSDNVTFETGSMYFTNKENADASAITFYVKNQTIADTCFAAFSTSSSYGLKIVSLDGNTTFYNTLK